MMSDLTVDNFITSIKAMSERERKKVNLAELINIIMQLPDDFMNPNETDSKIGKLETLMEIVQKQGLENADTIQNIQVENTRITIENNELKADLRNLRKEVDELLHSH